MVEAAEHLGVGAEVEARQVKERQQVAVADVEEEVVRPGVIAVLEDVGKRELEEALVELDRPAHIGREERDVVDAAGARGRAVAPLAHVAAPDLVASGVDGGEVNAAWALPSCAVSSMRRRVPVTRPATASQRGCRRRRLGSWTRHKAGP